MIFAVGSSGKSISAPVGPVISISSPGLESQTKFEATPLYTLLSGNPVPALSGLSSPTSRLANSPSTAILRFTQRDTVFPASSSPSADEAMEYKRTFAGVEPFLS